jgi:hypothetical protein
VDLQITQRCRRIAIEDHHHNFGNGDFIHCRLWRHFDHLEARFADREQNRLDRGADLDVLTYKKHP